MKSSHLLLIFLAILLLITPGSAHTWWQDHFTSDTSANYDGSVDHYTWNTALTTGWLNCTDPSGHRILHYKNEKFGGGWYNWSYTDYGTGSWPYIIWADTSAADTGDTGNPTTSGTKYYCRNWPSAWFLVQCGKVIGGVDTDLGQVGYTASYHYNMSVLWDPAAGNFKVYLNDILQHNINDNTITDPGYMGISYYTPGNQNVGWDVWNYGNETEAGPTPTPTTTPTPTSTPYTLPTEIPNGLYIGGEEVQPGILSGIFLVLDQNIFLLIGVVLLAYLIFRR